VLAGTGDLRETRRKVLDCSAKDVIGLSEGSRIVARLIAKLDSSPAAATSAHDGNSAANRHSDTTPNGSMTTTDGAESSDSSGADKSPTGGGVSSDNAP
jgi:hypothetical protein